MQYMDGMGYEFMINVGKCSFMEHLGYERSKVSYQSNPGSIHYQ